MTRQHFAVRWQLTQRAQLRNQMLLR